MATLFSLCLDKKKKVLVQIIQEILHFPGNRRRIKIGNQVQGIQQEEHVATQPDMGMWLLTTGYPTDTEL